MAINTLYLDNGVISSIKETYNKQRPKNIRLEKFFQSPVFLLLQKRLCNSEYSLKFSPYKCKYSITHLKEIDSFIHGQYFKKIIEQIIELKNYKIKYEIRKFEPGNYTLVHDSEKEKAGIDFFIDFSKNGRNYGGYTSYLTETDELIALNPMQNTISFIERKNGVMRYTKYVTSQQKYPIVQVSGTISKK